MENGVFATRLTEEIKRKGLTKKDFGIAVGVSKGMVSYWCNGKRLPLIPQVIDIANILGVSVDYLLGLSDTPNRLIPRNSELGLSDLAESCIRTMAFSSPERIAVLDRLLSDVQTFSIFGNLALSQKLRAETSGHIHSINLEPELLQKIQNSGYVVLSNIESADYIMDKSLNQIREVLEKGV